MFIEKIRKSFKAGETIFAKEILQLFPEFTKAYVYRLLKESIDNEQLIKFSRGIYCIPKKTSFGYSSLSPNAVASQKYISDGNMVYGLYSGLTLLNNFAISAQVPNVIEIVTNNEATRKRTIEINGVKFILRKSRFPITKDNYNYYTVLQIFQELGTNTKINSFSKKQISDYIKKNSLEEKELIRLAMRFPAQTLKNLIVSEVINGTL